MWGLMLQIRGAHVDVASPDWLLNANATFAAVNQVRRAANEMARHPDAYAFDPAATYTVFVQIWDRALTAARSVAFGRDVVGHRDVGLIPDPYYIDSRGFSALRRAAADLPRWAARSDVIAWRGSVTGRWVIAQPEDLIRVQLALACRDRPDADVGLLGVHPTMVDALPRGTIESFIASRNLLRDHWWMPKFGRHKFTFDIDGHANAWGLLEKLILGCCVLKVGSPYEQWFYDRLLPWRHFVPIKADLSDLDEIIAWCRENEAQCSWIASNGARLAAALTLERDLPRTCDILLKAAYAQAATPQTRRTSARDEAALPLLVRDEVERAERIGDLDQAIAGYARLVDVEPRRADTLMQRHNLLRERGDFVEALSDLERAAVDEPQNDEAALRLGQLLASVGRDMAAAPHLERAMASAPLRTDVRIALAGSCLNLGWLDRAFWTLRHTPDDLPGWWGDLRRQALVAHAERRTQVLAILAGRRAEGALSLEQTWELAVGLASLGRLSLAWRLCVATMARTPNATAPLELACGIVARRRGPAEAVDFLAMAITGPLDGKPSSLLLALLHFELADYAKALDILSSQLGIEVVSRRGLSIAAFCLIFLGRKPDLRAHCRAWMDRFPEDMLPTELVCAVQPSRAVAAPSAGEPLANIAIGQFWHDEAIPADVRAIMDTWTDHHPAARHDVYCLESARAFLLDHYDADTIRAFDACKDISVKAAFFRLGWLHRSGGVWVDVDQRCIRSVPDELAAAAAAGLTAVRSGYIIGYLESGFLGARAESLPTAMALRVATETILEATRRGEPIWKWAAVGSGLITRVVGRHLCKGEAVGDTWLLSPFSYHSYAITTNTLAYKARRDGFET